MTNGFDSHHWLNTVNNLLHCVSLWYREQSWCHGGSHLKNIKNVLTNHKLVSPCMMRSRLILYMGGRVMWTKNTTVYARAL